MTSGSLYIGEKSKRGVSCFVPGSQVTGCDCGLNVNLTNEMLSRDVSQKTQPKLYECGPLKWSLTRIRKVNRDHLL